ncbi:beta-1 adrenergic receptor-like [Patiria miniata]|uniref:G-protein coupled receptors family 1 profile domain-containing protein n=1 Tax=Patiria miniata TaxID=46514 RepID=A0A913ZS62_PATMI|nr:beta-1 adrenergic receptor-like [Patiria miniata]
MEKILVLRIYKTIVGIIGILGNGLVCLVIGKVSSMQTRTNAFIFHQAVVDVLGSTMILLQSEVPLPEPLPDSAQGYFICVIWNSNFVLFLLFVISTYNLLSLTMERYFAIVYPFKYQAAFAAHPRLKVGLIIAGCWVLGVAIKAYVAVIFEFSNGKCVARDIPISQVMGILTAVLQYVVPVAVMLFAHIRISMELKRGAARVGPAPAPAPTDAAPAAGTSNSHTAQPAPNMMESLMQARRNTFKTLLIVFITFVFCWTPNQFLFFMFNVGWTVHDKWYYLLSVAMVATNCCVNPVIYAFKYRQFRNGFWEMVGRGKRKRNMPNNAIATHQISRQIPNE